MRDTSVIVAPKSSTLIDDVVHPLAAVARMQMLMTPFLVVNGHGDTIVAHGHALRLGLARVEVPCHFVTGVTNTLRSPLFVERLAVAEASDTCHDGL